jgi:ParB/RepB/Spo0J family partition protein
MPPTRTVTRVSPFALVADPQQSRKTIDEAALQSLGDSIATFGLLHPIIVTNTDQGLTVVAGERRRQAAIQAGIAEVEVLIVDSGAAEISVIENLQRRDLHPIDEAEALERLRQAEHYTHEELAWLVGCKRSSISELLALARLPSSIKSRCRNSDVAKSLLIEVAKQTSITGMEALLDGIDSGKVSATNVRAYSRRRRTRVGAVAECSSPGTNPSGETAGPRETALVPVTSRSGWSHVRRPDQFHVSEDHWKLCLRNIDRGEPTLILGPTGCGKTELVYLAAKAVGRSVYLVNMGATTDARTALVGTTHFNGRQTVFHPSAMVKGMQDPRGLILLDEITRSPADAGHILFPLLDHQRMLSLDEADPPQMLHLHPDTVFFATANVGAEYTGTREIDRALFDRFMPIHLKYPPKSAEADALVLKTNVARPMSTWLVNVASECRELWQKETLSIPVSTRDLIRAAGLIVDGFDPMTALDVAVVSLFDDSGGAASERTIVRQIIQKF